jgi:hypothetical protein
MRKETMRHAIYPILVLIVSALLFPPPKAAQDRTAVNRLDTFLLNDQHYDPSGDWKGVFCRSDNQRNCLLAEVAVEQSKSEQEEVSDGRMAPLLSYVARPRYRALMFVKGLKADTGNISNALSASIEISAEPLLVSWDGETYQLTIDHFNLLVSKFGNNGAKQSIPLFIDPNEGCKSVNEADIRRRVMLQFMGDIDQDQKPDFMIYASAYRSCAITVSRTDPMPILLLSSQAPTGQLGRIVQSVAAMDMMRLGPR